MSGRRPVARYSTHGPFPGRVVILRHVEGEQHWLVRVSVSRGAQTDIHEIEPNERVDLLAITAKVVETIRELVGERERVSQAAMEFFIR